MFIYNLYIMLVCLEKKGRIEERKNRKKEGKEGKRNEERTVSIYLFK